jgi:hypothetical protein
LEILTLDEHREELKTEEALLWYALNHEESERAEDSQDALDEDDWWKRWLGRMEKRE